MIKKDKITSMIQSCLSFNEKFPVRNVNIKNAIYCSFNCLIKYLRNNVAKFFA